MQSFHHEESLLAASNARDRYRREFEHELGKSKDLARRLAVSEGKVSFLTKDLESCREEWRRKEQDLTNQLNKAANQAESSSSTHADSAVDALKAANRALTGDLERSREEVIDLKSQLEVARKHGKLYQARAEEAYKSVSESISKIATRGSAAYDGDAAEKVKELEVLNKHMKDALESAKQELSEAKEMRSEIERLRRGTQDADLLQAKITKLQELLATATAEEAALRGERDTLQHWKVALSIGMSECSTPAEVMGAFRQARETIVTLESKVSQMEERGRAAEQEKAALRSAGAEQQRRKEDAEVKVVAAANELMQEKATVERLKRELDDLKLMMKSFKAEEVLVRDDEVVALTDKLAKAEALAQAQAANSAAEVARGKQEVDRVREAQRKERETAGAERATLLKEKLALQVQSPSPP